ncbi:hypothetical protein L3Q67_32655 [Saccharothrix sp. AJ9571]|nr:hypothetical protein L3Q67_32655 [Saccharothrix sp. AJ9571]
MQQHADGTLVGLADYLYDRTGGMIGSLSQLVRGGAILAIDDGSEHLTRDLLDLVPVDFAATRAPQRPAQRTSGQRTPAARKARAR